MTLPELSINRFRFRCLIKSLCLIFAVTFLISGLFCACDQPNTNKPFDYIDLDRVGDIAIPATVYIEVIERSESVEPLPAFTRDLFFRRYVDDETLDRIFSDEFAGQGTGMIIDYQGHVLTNYHVVRGAAAIEVRLANGRWCLAKLIGADPLTDLAVIRISDQIPLPHVIFGDSSFLKLGEPVATLGYTRKIHGNPRPRLTPAVFGGLIRATQPNGIIFRSVCPEYWSTDAGKNLGNSGAPLLNRQGAVIGVDVAIVTQSDEVRTIGYAIPSNTAVLIAERLISDGRATGR